MARHLRQLNRLSKWVGPRVSLIHRLHANGGAQIGVLLRMNCTPSLMHDEPQQVRFQGHWTAAGSKGPYRGNKNGLTGIPSGAALRWEEKQREVLGEKSKEAADLERDLLAGKVNATQYLREQDAAGNATLEKVRVCLTWELRKIQKIPRKARLDMLSTRNDPFTSAVLNILWRDQTLWMPLFVYDITAARSLCYFAIAEGYEDLLLRWLNVDIDPTTLQPEMRGWNGWVLIATLAAHLMHTTDYSATRALQYFFDVVRKKTALRDEYGASNIAAPALSRLNLRGAVRLLVKELVGGRYHNTDPNLYQSFYHFFSRCEPETIGSPITIEFNHAALRTKHPTRPNPDAMLRFLHKYLDNAQSASDVRKFTSELPVPSQRLQMIMQQIRDILLKQNYPEDAEWVKQQAARFPHSPPDSLESVSPAIRDSHRYRIK